MPISVKEVRAKALVESRARARTRSALVGYARGAWLGLGSWRDADIDRFVERVVPKVLGAKRQVATLQSSYIPSVTSTLR